MDKSVHTFEQHTRFLSASFRNWKKNTPFLSISKTPFLFQCWNTLRGHYHVVTTLTRGEGVEMWKLEIENTHLQRNRFFSSVSTAFVHDCSTWQALMKYGITERGDHDRRRWFPPSLSVLLLWVEAHLSFCFPRWTLALDAPWSLVSHWLFIDHCK